jgi:MFS-type transporter involved in bile tolerance (Atg22 family)
VRWITGASLSRRSKSIFAILVSAIIGFASSFLSGQFDPGTVLKSIAICFSISQVVYDQVFKDIFNKREEQDIPFVQ